MCIELRIYELHLSTAMFVHCSSKLRVCNVCSKASRKVKNGLWIMSNVLLD